VAKPLSGLTPGEFVEEEIGGQRNTLHDILHKSVMSCSV
jgi:hypothetical protein